MADDFEEVVSETPKGKGTCELTIVMTTCIDLHKQAQGKQNASVVEGRWA